MIAYNFTNFQDESVFPFQIFVETFKALPAYTHFKIRSMTRKINLEEDIFKNKKIQASLKKLGKMEVFGSSSNTADENMDGIYLHVISFPNSGLLFTMQYYNHGRRDHNFTIKSLSRDELSFDLAKKVINEIFDLFADLIKIETDLSRINYVIQTKEGYELIDIGTPDVADDTDHLELHYNDDFKEVSDYIIDKLLNTRKGIVLLHGEPGTGKTSYIRYLIRHLNRRIIYLPPDLTRELSNPHFFTFLMEYPESILIIEDGENVIASREGGHNPTVANLLNVTDGILGDALKLQIICTFNAEIDQVDSALLRPGRLIAKHKFNKLSLEKTSALIKHLYPNSDVEVEEGKQLSLAEIFNLQEVKHIEVVKEKTFGFH